METNIKINHLDTEFDFSLVPTWYAICTNDHCPLKQDCLRYLLSGKRTKARFNVRYEDLKALGYRSLVNAYYDFSGNGPREAGEAPKSF